MSSLRDFQNSFGSAVRGAQANLDIVHAADPIPLERRLDVYRNNVHASLIDGLEQAFPVLLQLVGRDFFRAMAREYLRDHMPERGTLIGFGDVMPDFLDGFPPVASLPYLSDVARLELAWLRCYHAGDGVVLAADDLANIPVDDLAGLRFELHPSLATLQSEHPILSIWQAHQPGNEPASIDMTQSGETVLLIRKGLSVGVHKVSGGAAAFTEMLRSGHCLGVATDSALNTDSNFDLGHILHFLLSGGGFARLIRS